MNKIKVLDTNILIYDPQVLFNYPNELIVIPLVVIKELDKHKNSTTIGHQARKATNDIWNYIIQQSETIESEYSNEGDVRKYSINDNDFYFMLKNTEDKESNDDTILSIAVDLSKKFNNVELISMDTNLRIKAHMAHIKCPNFDYKNRINHLDDVYRGYKKLPLDKEVIEKFIKTKDTSLLDYKPSQNEYLFLKDKNQKKNGITTVRYQEEIKENEIHHNIKVLDDKKELEACDLEAKNAEQWITLDALLDPDIHFVTICGKAGSGKTLLALAAGLQQVLNGSQYKKVLIARPVQPMGKDIGYLPGDINEKMTPWMRPIFDNLEILFPTKQKKSISKISDIPANLDGKLEIEPLTYIRGRTISNSFLIVDEAQNLSPHMAKTILTRAGEDTKVIFTGDPDQIDDPYLNSVNNGLVQMIEAFKEKGEGRSAHIVLETVERSILADISSKILKS